MAIQRPDPLRSLVELRERMNRMFEETLSRSFETSDGESEEPTAWKPSVDLFEQADRYVMRIDLPGVPAAEVQLQVERDALVLSETGTGRCHALPRRWSGHQRTGAPGGPGPQERDVY